MTAVADSRGGRSVAAPSRPKGRTFNVKTMPGFAVMAWFCVVALYTPIHCILFALFGIVVMFLTHRAQRQPSILMLALILFVVFEVGFTGLVAMLEQTALGDLAWYQVAIGNLIAVALMGWYVVRRHPGMKDVWGHRLDDQG